MGHGVYQKIETVILSAVRCLLSAACCLLQANIDLVPCALGLEPSLWDGHYLSRPPGSVNVTRVRKISVGVEFTPARQRF